MIYPLVIYMAIGMAVLGLYPNGGLMANLIEKVSCIIIMGILFYKDFVEGYEDGMAMVDIAKRNHVSERTIYRYKAYYDKVKENGSV